MRTFLIVISVVLFSLTGCKSEKGPAKLGGMKWVLKSLNGKEVVLSEPDNSMYIFFNDGEKKVNGRAACNRFFGDFEITGTELKFSPVGATRMACPNDSKWESAFFLMLEKVDGYSVKENILAFTSEGKEVAKFEGQAMCAKQDK